MPTKKEQRRAYLKKKVEERVESSSRHTSPSGSSILDITVREQLIQTDPMDPKSTPTAPMEPKFSNPSTSSSKKRGRPKKQMIVKPSSLSDAQITSKDQISFPSPHTPRTSRLASKSSELNSPLPKKDKIFCSFSIQQKSVSLDFSKMSTLKFAKQISSTAMISKDRGMLLYNNNNDQMNCGPTIIEKLWNNLDLWLSDCLIYPYLCLLASKSDKCIVVVDPFATDPSRNVHGKPASRRIRNSCFVSQPDKQPEIFLMPQFFDGHWALLIFDRVIGMVFLDSLEQNPDRMHSQNPANTNRVGITRAELIQGVLREFLPDLIGHKLPIQVPQGIAQQPDLNSCGYYCCLYAESWLFDNESMNLESIDLIAEKKRILWHMNELYSTDDVEFHSRYATPQTDVAIDSLSLSEGDNDSVMSIGSNTSKQSSRTKGRPKKQKGGPGRPKKTSTPATSDILSPQVGTQGSVQKPPHAFVQSSSEIRQLLEHDTLDIPAGPNPYHPNRIATPGLLQAGEILQQLWTDPKQWLSEDLIYAFQRYIATKFDGRHVIVLDPLCTNLETQFGDNAMPLNAIENCFNYSPDYDILLMTICFPGHFALIIFDRTVREEPQCLFIDPRPEMDRIYEVNYPHYDPRRLELITSTICELTPGLTHADFQVQRLTGQDFTPQNDGINCGFFVCMYPESYLLDNGSLHLPNLDINYQRRRILYHLSQLMAINNVPYIPLKKPTQHPFAAMAATAGPMSEADLSGFDVILESAESSDTESVRESIPVRRSPKIRGSVASSRSVTPDRQSNASSTASQTKSNRITRRCHLKHKGLPCADFRANHIENYHDSGNLGDAICDYCGALLFAYEAEKRNGKMSSGACCNHGKVVLPPLRDPPSPLKHLLKGKSKESLEFLDKENTYNSLLAFASISVGHHDSHLDTGTCFLLNGEFMRSVSSMFPGKFAPSFSQLYILDPAAAQEHREKNVKYGGDRVNKKLLADLDAMLRTFHPLAKELMSFKDQYERELAENGPDAVANYRFTILEARDVPKSIRDPTLPPNMTNLPDESEQGAMFAVWTEYDHPPEQKGIWIETDEGKLKKIPAWHPKTDTLCYPLLFPWGDDGFHHKIPLNLPKKSGKNTDDEALSVDDDEKLEEEEVVSEDESVYTVADDGEQDLENDSTKQRQYASFRQYIRYRMRIRKGQKIHHIWSAGGGLGQKYDIDCSTRIDSDRDSYLNKPELDLRGVLPENYLQWMAKNAGVASPEEIGSVVLFRQCHPGTRPHMQGKYYDATTIMARVRKPGRASFMFTFTANPRWPEIRRNFLHENQSTVNRPDLMCLIFEEKFQFLRSLMDRNLFGKIFAQISREYQKKFGGPHIHAVFESDILAIPENIDNLIWAHIPPAPDPNDHSDYANFIRKVRELLPKYQFHDCGPRCLKNGKCTRGFPKHYRNETILFDDRPAQYKRPKPEDGGEEMYVQRGKKMVKYDNSRVSAYNPLILVLMETHHNLEFGYGKSGAYKYAAKYPFKATSFLYIKSEENDGKVNVNEPKYYSKNYYRPATEAFDRIFGHKYAFLSHTVIRLNVHLPNKQRIYLKPGQLKDKQAQQRLQQQILTNQLPETPLSAYWKQWAKDPALKDILFEHMPETYSYNKGAQVWKKRKLSTKPKNVKKRKPIIGRICPISPRDPELFALYLLIRHFPGDPDHLKTVDLNGTEKQCTTFLEAARLRGLLDDDDVWKRTLQDASKSYMPNQMRQLLAQILVFGSTQNCLVDGLALWNQFIRHFYDSRCTAAQRPGREDRALAALERLLVAQGRCLSDYGLPAPSVSMVKDPSHGLKAYFFPQQQTNDDDDDVIAVDTTKFQNVQLNPKQQEFCDLIKSLFDEPQRHRLHRLAGGGGTGKTFLLDYLLYLFREAGKKVMPVASTGMAATRFHSGGMTMHSMFRMGIQVERGKLPQIPFESFFGRRIIEAEIIMLDEMTALNRVVFENADLICQQLCKDKRPFGGKIVIISGDWKQQLTVAEDSNPGAQIAACLQSSHLYPLFKKFELTQNMRLLPNQISHLEWLDKVGKGEFGEYLPIEKDMLLNSREELVEWVYDKGFDMSSEELLKRLVLAVTNRTVDLINASVLRQMNKPIVDYYSVDKALEEDPFAVNAADYEVAQINELNPTGVPAHHIRLCLGALIVLLMNFIPGKGLCNGTRLVAKELTNNLISGEAITGGASGGTTFGINRVRHTHPPKNPHDVGFERFQFPVRLAYAMTIAKAQGQTCDRVGIDLTDQCWTHGQLYTALTRARSRQGIKIYVPNAKIDDQGRVLVRNVVSMDIDLD